MAEAVGIRLTGDWGKAQDVLVAPEKVVKGAITKALFKRAHAVAADMRDNLRKMDVPNAPSTIFLKGSDKPLINHGDLLNSIDVVKKNDLEFFVGIPASSARGVRLAPILEEGRTIVMQITPKQRAFLHWLRKKMGKPLGHGTGGGETNHGFLIIHIPARPFIRPAIEKAQKESAGEFITMIVEELKDVLP